MKVRIKTKQEMKDTGVKFNNNDLPIGWVDGMEQYYGQVIYVDHQYGYFNDRKGRSFERYHLYTKEDPKFNLKPYEEERSCLSCYYVDGDYCKHPSSPCNTHEKWVSNEDVNEKDFTDIKNDPVEHPNHYTQAIPGIEVIDITKHLDFCRGSAIKYILRCQLKGDFDKEMQDIDKAIQFLKFYKEKRQEENE